MNRSPDNVASASEESDTAPPLTLLASVREAWCEARSTPELHTDALTLALDHLARAGRTNGVSVESLLKLLDHLAGRGVRHADFAAGFNRVREWAGRQVIRSYYRDD